MKKTNISSFEPFFGDDIPENQLSSPLFAERSKSVSHENRFRATNESLSDYENSQNSTEIKEIQS